VSLIKEVLWYVQVGVLFILVQGKMYMKTWYTWDCNWCLFL